MPLNYNTLENCCNGIAASQPNVFYDFAGTRSLSPTSGAGDLTITRAGNALAYDHTGILRDWAADTPRFSHDASGGSLGLLSEYAATNLMFPTSSPNVSTGVFAATTNANVTANNTTAPDGATTAAKLFDDATATAAHYLSTISTATIGLAGATQYTISTWFKETGGAKRYPAFFIPAATVASAANELIQFDCSGAGAVTQVTSGATAYIVAAPNGWYRCEATFTTAASPSGAIRFQLSTVNGSAATTYSGDSASGIYFWGAQIEAGDVATSLIRTTGASAARVADTITRTITADGISTTALTLYAELRIRRMGTALRDIFQLDDGTANNRHALRRNATAQAAALTVDGGVTQAALTGVTPFTADTTVRIAYAITAGDFAMSTQGAASVTDAAGTMPVGLTTLRIGGTSGTSRPVSPVAKIAIFNSRLSNASIEALSAP